MTFYQPEPKTKHEKSNVAREAMGMKPKAKAGKFSHIHIEKVTNGYKVRHQPPPDMSHGKDTEAANKTTGGVLQGPGSSIPTGEEHVFQHGNQVAKHVMYLLGQQDADAAGETAGSKDAD